MSKQSPGFNRRIRLSKLLLLPALMLSLCIGSAGQTIPARAAPFAQEIKNWTTRYHMGINLVTLNGLVCAGQDYHVEVTVLASSDGKINGEKTNYEKVLGGITVESGVTDESIGTIAPKKLVTGFSWVGEEHPSREENPNTAVFTFHAMKAGTTNMIFEALIRKAVTRDKDEYIGPLVPVKVVNCKYHVTVDFEVRTLGGGGSGWLAGYLEADIGSEGGAQFTGSGTLTTMFGAFIAAAGASCTSLGGGQSPTNIVGRFNDKNELELNFHYQTSAEPLAVTCAGYSVSVAPNIDYSSLFVNDATLPSTGGVQWSSVSGPGGSGTGTITAVPIVDTSTP